MEAVELLVIDEWGTSSLRGECDVIIVNYNAGELLLACVRSAFAAGASSVIVVDNDSHDDSLMLVERTHAVGDSLQIVRNAANLGFAVACNQGARLSAAPNLFFLNPDTVLAADAIDHLLLALRSSPEIGMVGGFLCNPDGSEQAGGRRVFPTPRRAFMRAFGLSRLSALFPSLLSDFLLHKEPLPGTPIVVEAISGACMLVKREAIESVGLWDEDYFLHCEDLDWCMRFHQAGWRVLFVPDAQVMHVFGGCSRQRPYFVEWHKHLGILRFYRKFFRRKYPAVLWVSVVIGVWFRFSLMVLRHAATRFKHAWNLR
ncbi:MULTISPECIES: glycosyltransferase family 2 protein [Pseudomonas]|uniref:glycosyltransferase family 2 protein n=1 Tax=Pseudomonas TaxID=286 RepID=UPI00031B1BD3|nr:glycosyltransferase family 2 protein [Pseudomonas brassicacearum]ROM95051.1 dTDP-Rha--alpha-D-GlcNAc-pyrophosphate polyprenol alpha-3-L-rhamnosyltransferase [Pseudomonas brassicacearum]ROM95916.1 dTDP-Rha--alpha-D-GlcNAc-pyrophosphate polyprenol alpha-3-L-rhamnosyltransferase [Pseudomonas brassicacearum]